MNFTAIQKKFQSVGTDIEVINSRYRYTHDKVWVEAKSNMNMLKVFIDGRSSDVELIVNNVDKQRGVILFSVSYNELDDCIKKKYLFSCKRNNFFVTQVPQGVRDGVKEAIRVISDESEKENQKKQDRITKNRRKLDDAFKRKENKMSVPDEEKLRRSGIKNQEQIDFYYNLINKCIDLKLKIVDFIVGDRPVNYPVILNGWPDSQYWGHSRKNRFSEAFTRVAEFSVFKIRDIESWNPKTRNVHRQFSSLVRHLFAEYKLPNFMDSVWFRESDEWVFWFLEIGQGKNIRKMPDLPIKLTKKMAHSMMNSPTAIVSTIEEAMCWGQITAIGGDKKFYDKMKSLRPLNLNCSANEVNVAKNKFWQTVMEWFLRHPMLDYEHYGPIVDYINNHKFHNNAENPDFEIVGRSPLALMRSVDEWHGTLNKGSCKDTIEWSGLNIDWIWEEKKNDMPINEWTIVEITSNHELKAEGKAMRHCIFSYLDSCQAGEKAVFSLCKNLQRVATIAYVPPHNSILDVRGHCNKTPNSHEISIINKWARKHAINRYDKRY